MIDPKDNMTVDAFPVKRRGRPKAKKKALTPAQRMANKRARDQAVIDAARLQADYASLSTMGLLQAMADAVKNKYYKAAQKIAAELVKRARLE